MAFGMLASIFVLLCTCIVNGQIKCPNTFAEFGTCLYQRIENQHQIQHSLLNENVQKKINKCFKDNDCLDPDYEHDPCMDLPQPIKSFVDKVRQEIGTAPSGVERCLKAKFSKSTSECINAIGLGHLISNASIDQVRSTNQVYGDANGFFFVGGMNSNSSNATEKRKSAFIQVNIATAIRQCKDKKSHDESKIRPMLKCLLDTLTSDSHQNMCEAANSCDGIGSTSDCKRQNRQTLRVLCTCKREKQNDVLRKLDLFRSKESVPVLDVITALGNGRKPEDTCKDIQKCFVENDSAPPPTLSLLEMYVQMQQNKQPGDKAGASQMRVDKKTLNVIRDLYDVGDFGDDECRPCEL